MLGSTETLENSDESLGGGGVEPGGTRAWTRQLQISSDDSSASTPRARPPSSKDHIPDHDQDPDLDGLVSELAELRENHVQLEEYFDTLKSHYQQEYANVTQSLQEEKYRCENMEEQLNDLTELYSNEMLNLKEELASIDEKLLYQYDDRAAHVNEVLGACQTRLSTVEQQQQAVHAAGERVTAQTLVWDLLSGLLTFLAVILTFVATVVNCVLSVTTRSLSHLLFVLLCVALVYHSQRDAFSDLQHYICKYKP